ncbi:transposase [Rubrivirga sp.]|uniref:transposase n=1 Tax=Rubrivirga sp. TaxID=1885344 RepID=UPI003C780B35
MTLCPLCDLEDDPVSVVAEPSSRYRGYRIPSARLPSFDYGVGVFFVTIATRGRAPWFGVLEGGQVAPSWAGRVVLEEWERTGTLRPAVTPDAFIAMPDHVHGILSISAEPAGDVETPRRGVTGERGASWRSGVLGAVIGRFKAQCTRRIRERHPDFAWQPRFWDVVIRDERHLEAARRYVLENPTRG